MVEDNLGTRLEAVLSAYRRSLGGSNVGVPEELLKTATPLREERVAGIHMGPGDITCDDAFGSNHTDEASGSVPTVSTESVKGATSEVGKVCGSDLGGPGLPGKPSGSDTTGQTGATMFKARQAVDSSFAILDLGEEDITPLQLWSLALKKYNILEECGEILEHPNGYEETAKVRAIKDENWAI